MKRLLSALLLLIIIAGHAVFADEKQNEMTYDRAVSLMLEANTSLMRMEKAVSDAHNAYTDSLGEAEEIDVEGMTVTFMNRERYIEYDNYTKMNMMKQKELIPEQMKNMWITTKESRDSLRDSLVLSLRGMYAMLYGSFCSFSRQKERDALAQDRFEIAESRYNAGIISEITFSEAQLDLQKQKMLLKECERNLENSTRIFNSFTGVDLQCRYDTVILDEILPGDVHEEGVYQLFAVRNRTEILQKQRIMELMLLEKEIMERNGVHTEYEAAKNSYDMLVEDIRELKLDIEDIELTVMDQVRESLLEVKQLQQDIDLLAEQMVQKQQRIESMRKESEQDREYSLQIREAEISLKELKDSWIMLLFEFETRMMKLDITIGKGLVQGR